MSEYWFSVSGDTVTLHTPSIGLRSHTEEALRGFGWASLKHFVTTLRNSGHPQYDERTSPIDSDAEMLALQTRPQNEPASCGEEKPKTDGERFVDLDEAHDALDAALNAAEPQRAPLPGYGQRTPFDPWGPEFIVHHREEVSVNAPPFAGLSLDGCSTFVLPKQAF